MPVVTAKNGSVPKVVSGGATGIITSLNVQEIANALEKLAHDSALRHHIGDARKKFTLANFGVERLVHDHKEIYKNVFANRAKS